MSVGAVNKQTGERIPTAGMPAIDNALSATSTNPVQNAIITAALANKQDKTDNNLQTTDKTVVGAINEHEGDIGSLKSGLINVDNGLTDISGISKKNYAMPRVTETETVYGVTFTPTETGVSIASGIVTGGTINKGLVRFTAPQTGKYYVVGAKLEGEVTNNYRTFIYDITNSASILDLIISDSFLITLQEGHDYVISINAVSGINVPAQDIAIMVCRNIDGDTFVPYYQTLADISAKVPLAPTTNGTYTLKVTVASGTPSYSWVADTP